MKENNILIHIKSGELFKIAWFNWKKEVVLSNGDGVIVGNFPLELVQKEFKIRL